MGKKYNIFTASKNNFFRVLAKETKDIKMPVLPNIYRGMGRTQTIYNKLAKIDKSQEGIFFSDKKMLKLKSLIKKRTLMPITSLTYIRFNKGK